MPGESGSAWTSNLDLKSQLVGFSLSRTSSSVGLEGYWGMTVWLVYIQGLGLAGTYTGIRLDEMVA